MSTCTNTSFLRNASLWKLLRVLKRPYKFSCTSRPFRVSQGLCRQGPGVQLSSFNRKFLLVPQGDASVRFMGKYCIKILGIQLDRTECFKVLLTSNMIFGLRNIWIVLRRNVIYLYSKKARLDWLFGSQSCRKWCHLGNFRYSYSYSRKLVTPIVIVVNVQNWCFRIMMKIKSTIHLKILVISLDIAECWKVFVNGHRRTGRGGGGGGQLPPQKDYKVEKSGKCST
jgi:hypothetical protein